MSDELERPDELEALDASAASDTESCSDGEPETPGNAAGASSDQALPDGAPRKSDELEDGPQEPDDQDDIESYEGHAAQDTCEPQVLSDPSDAEFASSDIEDCVDHEAVDPSDDEAVDSDGDGTIDSGNDGVVIPSDDGAVIPSDDGVVDSHGDGAADSNGDEAVGTDGDETTGPRSDGTANSDDGAGDSFGDGVAGLSEDGASQASDQNASSPTTTVPDAEQDASDPFSFPTDDPDDANAQFEGWEEVDPLGEDWAFVEVDEASAWPDDEPHESVALEKVNTTVRLPAVTEAPSMNGRTEEPQLSDVADTFVLWLQGRINALGSFLTRHRLAAALAGLACVAAILVAVLLGLDASKVPPEELIKNDAQALLTAPTYTVGNFASDDPLVLQAVDITSIRESDEVKGASEVEVLATFTNPVMETRADARLVYQRKGDEWACIDSSVGKASHHATAGVNQQLVVKHVAELLRKADTRSDSEGLASLYRNAEIEITNEEFSEESQTDIVELHCTSGGTFVDYECDLTARFRFVPASGAWELAEAAVSDGAYDLGFSPLLGTWKGTFASQQSSSYKCLAAREAGIGLTITQAAPTTDGSAIVEGTLSGIAHMHADLDSDAAATEGDAPLEAVPFSGTLQSSTDADDILELLMEPESESAGIVFNCTVQDVTGGSVELTLTLGQADDPDAATATLTSTYVYRDTFLLLVPYDRQSSFVDTFVLQKEGSPTEKEGNASSE